MCAVKSLSFDGAGEFYDRTRALPEEVAGRVTELLAGRLHGAGVVLEIGVGTGRVAYPLACTGVEVIGIDLSGDMLSRLKEKCARGSGGVTALRADATRSPFRNDSFGAALACHVLHLIPSWRDAIDELVRVVRPGGHLLLDVGGPPSGSEGEAHKRFNEIAGLPGHRGAQDAAEVTAYLQELGAAAHALEPIEWVTYGSLAQTIDSLEGGISSITWGASPDARSRAAAAVRTWARERYGSLTRLRKREHSITWHAYELPG